MRSRLSLETLESRITPTALGTLSFDAVHHAVTYTTLPSHTGTVALQPPSAVSATGLIATAGSLTTGNLTDSYSIANAAQGSTLTVAIDGDQAMGLSVVDQYGHVLAQQTGSGALSLTLTNLPASGGVMVLVTGSAPTHYLLTSLLTGASASSTPPPAPVTASGTLSSLGPQIIDPNGVLDPSPVDEIVWEWVSIGNIRLYDPVGRPVDIWSPYSTNTQPK